MHTQLPFSSAGRWKSYRPAALRIVNPFLYSLAYHLSAESTMPVPSQNYRHFSPEMQSAVQESGA